MTESDSFTVEAMIRGRQSRTTDPRDVEEKPRAENSDTMPMAQPGKLAKNEYSDQIIDDRRGLFCNESSSSLFDDKDLQLDMLEGSLLNEVGVESIIDIRYPSGQFSITASSTIPKIPSHSKFLHLESNMLSPVQSNKIVLPFLSETSTRKCSSNDRYVKPSPQTEQKNEDIQNLKSVEDTLSISLTFKDHDYCLNEVECSKNKDRNLATPNMLHLQRFSKLTKNFSKAFLKSVGLTNINLETLADTHSISLSLHEVKVAGATARHVERVKLRRKDFLKVMKSDKIINKNQNDAYLEVTGMSCELLDGSTTMRQIEFITDLLYCVHKLPNEVQHLLSYDPRYSIKNQNAEVTGFDELQAEEKLKQNCKDHRLLLTKRMASVSPTLKEEAIKISSYLYDNPPAVETSRSVSLIKKKAEYFYESSKESVTNNHGDHKSSPKSNIEEKKTYNEHKKDMSTRQLRSRKIRLTVHIPQKKSVGSNHLIERKDIEKPAELSRKYDEELILNKPTEMLKEWLSVSDSWLKESLDVESMLTLI